MTLKPGWYRTVDDSEVARQWDGSKWLPGGRYATKNTPDFPQDSDAPKPSGHNAISPKQRAAKESSGASSFVGVLSVLYGLAGAVTGVILAVHSRKVGCSVDDLGDRTCHGTEHPFVGVGLGLAFGALFMAAIAFMIAAHVKLRALEVLS